jgi:hypothetical protein
VKAFLSAGGQISSWSQAAGPYRFGLCVHEPPQAELERVKVQTDDLLSAPGNAGPIVSNLPVIESRRTKVLGKPCRVVLFDAGDRRILTSFFFVDGRMVFLFVEQAGASLDMDDQNAAAFFNSVSVTPS